MKPSFLPPHCEFRLPRYSCPLPTDYCLLISPRSAPPSQPLFGLTPNGESATYKLVNSATKNWIASADYDLVTAGNLLKTRRFIYVVFFCHLAIEKALKAIYSKRFSQMPPYTHNLNRLIEVLGISLENKHRVFIDRISLQSVPTRYPSDLARLSRQLNKKAAEEHLKQTRQVIKWLKKNFLT